MKEMNQLLSMSWLYFALGIEPQYQYSKQQLPVVYSAILNLARVGILAFSEFNLLVW